ncbi:MAG: hypothetical protein KAZ87_15010 [Spirochaetes bacterium]|nr:hypothetical protein [Spirochaetota bacterium]
MKIEADVTGLSKELEKVEKLIKIDKAIRENNEKFLGLMAAIMDFKFVFTEAMGRELEKSEPDKSEEALAISPERVNQAVHLENFWIDEAEEVIGKLKAFERSEKKYHNFRDELPKKSRKRKKW